MESSAAHVLTAHNRIEWQMCGGGGDCITNSDHLSTTLHVYLMSVGRGDDFDYGSFVLLKPQG